MAEPESTRRQPGAARTGGRYEVRELLGEGVLGPRFLAVDLEKDETVTFEQVRLPTARDAIDRLRKTIAELDAAVPAVPRIGRVHGLVESGPDVFVVCDFMGERTLASLLEGGAPLAGDRVVEYARLLAETLARAHEAGLTHGRLSPAAVSIGPEGPALADLALVQVARGIGLIPAQDDDRQRDWRDWARLVVAMTAGARQGDEARIDEAIGAIGAVDARLEDAVTTALEGKQPNFGESAVVEMATRPLIRPDRSVPWWPLFVMATGAVLIAAAWLMLSPAPGAASSPKGGDSPGTNPVEAPPAQGQEGPPSVPGAMELPETLRTSISLRPQLPQSASLDDPATTPAAPGEGKAPGVSAGLDDGAKPPPQQDGLAASSVDSIPDPDESAEDALRNPVVPGVATSWADPAARAAWERAARLVQERAADGALRATAELIAEHPTDTGVWHVRACALIAADNTEVGARLLRAVLGADRSNALAWYNLGVARLKADDREGAGRAFTTFAEHAHDPAYAALKRRVDAYLVSR